MRRRYGYDSYRGRSPLRTILKVVALLLALVLILGVAGLLFLEPYWVYSADGAKLRTPWSAPAPTSQATPEPLPSAPLVLITPQVPEAQPLHAAALPREALYDGSAPERLAQVGAQAALFDMKADDGTLGYVSELTYALTGGITAEDGALNSAIEALTSSGLYTVARVSCFRDNALPKNDNSLAIRSPSGNWRDSGGYRWLSPSNADAREYLTGICLELAALGFDEILLDHAGYPTDGELDYIREDETYDGALLSSTVTDFYAALAQTLGEAYPEVTLSAVSTPSVLQAGTDPQSGQTTAAMADSMGRIWVHDLGPAWTACADALTQSGLEEPEVNLVDICAEIGAEKRSWCLWNGI